MAMMDCRCSAFLILLKMCPNIHRTWHPCFPQPREKFMITFSALLENVSFVDIQTFKKLAQEHLEIEKPGLRYIKIIYHLTDRTKMEQNPSHIVPSENLSFSGKPQGEDEI